MMELIIVYEGMFVHVITTVDTMTLRNANNTELYKTEGY